MSSNGLRVEVKKKIWELNDIKDMAKGMGKEIDNLDAYKILKNVYNEHGKIQKKLIKKAIELYNNG